jgi:DNA anti-recombination protein RmuC
MPVTAKLSKAFYDRFGDQIANEIVEWYNQVDATYRSDLERLNEASFQRFSAQLDARVAASEARFDGRLEALEHRLQQQLGALEHKLQQQLVAIESRLQQQTTGLESELRQRLASLEATLERRLGDQTRWMFVAWASLLVPIIGLWMRG